MDKMKYELLSTVVALGCFLAIPAALSLLCYVMGV